MTSTDLDKARSRFLNALRRINAGIEIQRDRILNQASAAPKLLEGTPYEVTDLTGETGNDVDYYIYELARLQDVARQIIDVFDSPQAIVDALTAFDAAIPNLRKARNPLTHISNDARLDDVLWFSSLVKAKPDGSVGYLVDPRYQHHEAARQLGQELVSYLRAGLQTT